MKGNDKFRLLAPILLQTSACYGYSASVSMLRDDPEVMFASYESDEPAVTLRTRIDLFKDRLDFGQAGSTRTGVSEFGKSFTLIEGPDAVFPTGVPILAPKRQFTGLKNGNFVCSSALRLGGYLVTCISTSGRKYHSIYRRRRRNIVRLFLSALH